MQQRKTTIDHDEIREWIETRGGRPAVLRDTWNGQSGELSVDFGNPNAPLEEITWDDFFRIFDERECAFVCQEETMAGTQSTFFKFVGRAKAMRGAWGGNGNENDDE